MKTKFLILIFLATSCSPTIKNFGAYQKQFFPRTEFMPNKEDLEKKHPKVVVFALDENDNQVATLSQLGNSMANDVENILAQNRLAELIDRKAAQKLQKEIALSEMAQTGSYKGPKIADFAISGSISNAGFTSKYSGGGIYYTKHTGLVTTPPNFKYSSEVAGNLKIYELPSLTVINTIEFSGKETRSENVRQNGGFSLGALQVGGEKVEGAKRDDNLVRNAGEEAIKNIIIDLKNALAKKGYILEKRSLNKKVIFKVNLGSLDGLKKGDKFTVMGQYQSQNAITDEIEIEKRIIATGTVTDVINPTTSWVVIDDKEKIDSIRLGDYIKMKYKKGFFSGVTKWVKSLF